MSDQFPLFSKQVRANFDGMVRNLKEHEIFIIDVNSDIIWEFYLSAFPDGSNPIFRVRTEHDCSCCRNFIKNVAGMVQIIEGQIMTIWDNTTSLPWPYNVVGDAMNEYVRSFAIRNVYRTAQPGYGAEKTIELLEGSTRTWHHFSASMPRQIMRDDVPEFQGNMAATFQVMQRGLEEIEYDALEQIVEMIQQNILYRGQEHQAAVAAFMLLKNTYRQLNNSKTKELFIWSNIRNRFARFKNTVIGTLATDLSEGIMDTEGAVRSFELKVAPANYKRPTALITPRMVKDAEKTLIDLGMGDSIHRRFATISDITINNVLWANRDAESKMRGSFITDLLSSETTKPVVDPSVFSFVDILPEHFIDGVLPSATSVELFVDNGFQSNFVSLTAPQHADTKTLFKWSNDFAWSYDGDITDSSIQKRVKEAGGRVVGAKMRVSLAWFNTDDLDIHVQEPNGNIIYFRNKCDKLDVDMNAGYGQTTEPVENVSWMKTPMDGIYNVTIHNFNRRNSHAPGFDLEVESNGSISSYNYPLSVANDQKVPALALHVKNGQIVKIDMGNRIVQTQGASGVEKWGVITNSFVPVQTILHSPNHWDGQEIGNLHTFFILEGCANPEPTRGIYNEFLSSALEKHRKVFEVLGSKTKCPVPPNVKDQLSGLGFSSTKRAEVKVKVKTNTRSQAYNLVF